jgi:hypothetical protein
MTRTPAGNRRLAQWRVKCFYDSLVKGSSFVLLMNICAKNPPLRQAPKRYVPFLNDNANRYRQTNEFT